MPVVGNKFTAGSYVYFFLFHGNYAAIGWLDTDSNEFTEQFPGAFTHMSRLLWGELKIHYKS